MLVLYHLLHNICILEWRHLKDPGAPASLDDNPRLKWRIPPYMRQKTEGILILTE